MIGVYNYVLYSGDFEWLSGIWSNYTKAIVFMATQVDDSGLANFTSGSWDWGRQGMGGYNSEGNALYYKVRLCLSARRLALVCQQEMIGTCHKFITRHLVQRHFPRRRMRAERKYT
jgi:hypothetical protein